jgi:hypothetical protein
MDCAVVPSSSGPLTPLAELVVESSGAAPSATVLRARVTVRVGTTGPRMITTPATSALLVVSGDRIVARRNGAAGSRSIPLILRAGAVVPAQAVPGDVLLAAADGADPLTPGRYVLVAVLGYQADSFNSRTEAAVRPPTGARNFVLVSDPEPIEVR